MSVAHLGSEHAFSGQAARAHFGEGAEYLSAQSFAELFQLVEEGSADVAVVPVENVLAGAVDEVLDLIASTSLTVTCEFFFPVELCLAGLGTLEQVTRIYSHPKALEQCRGLLPSVERCAVSDTAKAAEFVSKSGNVAFAAITSSSAASAHGLRLLKENIADGPLNGTRFFVLQRGGEPVEGSDTCSLIICLPHRVGALASSLHRLAALGMNLTRIESRPIFGRPFEYRFYLDVTYSGPKPNFVALLPDVENIKVLGHYKRQINC